MKNKILFTGICIIFTIFQVQSQVRNRSTKDSIEIIRFCGFTETYDCVFGIHIDKEKAIGTVLTIMDKEKGSENMLTEMIIAAETMDKEKGLSIHQQFEKVSSKGYHKITHEEFIKLSIAEKKALLGNSLLQFNY